MEATTLTIDDLRRARVAGEFSAWDVAQRLEISLQKLYRLEAGHAVEVPADFTERYQRILVQLDEERRREMLAPLGGRA